MKKLDAKYDMHDQVMDTVACCVKVKVPDSLAGILNRLCIPARLCVDRMLAHRDLSSSKHYPEIPSVIAKSLIFKYQRNKKCKRVVRLVLPLVGDKGKQIKLEGNGIRIPALFKKKILPLMLMRPVVGFVRSAEFLLRKGQWYASVCYNTPAQATYAPDGCVGIDRNSVGHVATMSDPQNGKVRHLGYNPAGSKKAARQRRANLQSLGAGGRRVRRSFNRKQSRQSTYENHCVSRQIVSYAKLHRRAIAVEDLETIGKGKARRYVRKSQWAFFQLLQFIRYKAALLGISVILVDPAYSSQECSRCGERNKPNGKSYACAHCQHTDHRDANAGFVIAGRGNRTVSMGSAGDSVSLSGAVLVTPTLEVW